MSYPLLSPRVLSDTLTSSTSESLPSAVLLTADGQLMAFSKDLQPQGATLLAGLVSTLWRGQMAAAVASRIEPNLNFILMENDDGLVGMATCHEYILCMTATSDAHLGMLKSKLMQLAKMLEKPLADVTPPNWQHPDTTA